MKKRITFLVLFAFLIFMFGQFLIPLAVFADPGNTHFESVHMIDDKRINLGGTTSLETPDAYIQWSGTNSRIDVVGATRFASAVTLASTLTLGGSLNIPGDLTFSTGAARSIYVAQAATGLAGNNLTMAAGAALDSNMNGGNLALNAGAKHGSGANGTASLGGANTSAVNLAATTITTTAKGPLTVDEALSANGNSTLGNASTDDITLTGSVASDLNFKTGAARTLKVAQAATGLAGNNLSIAAGAALDSDQNGGTVAVDGGAKHGSGTNGAVNIGGANTSAVGLAATGITTTAKGPLTVDEAANLNGNTTLGNAATDELTVTAIIASDLTFKKGSARIIKPQQAADSTAGDNISLIAGQGGTTTGAGGNIAITAGAAAAGGANGGNASVNAGAKNGAGTDGSLSLGTANTEAVGIGISTKKTTINGTMDVAEAFQALGNATLGNAAADDITLTGSVASDVTFKAGSARTIKPAQAADSTAGDKVSLKAGAGGTTIGVGGDLELVAGAASAGGSNGGNVTLDAGAKNGAGTDGTIAIGGTTGSALNLSKSGVLTNVKGTSQFDENANFNGAITTIGNAAGDTLVLTGVVNSDITFQTGADRALSVQQALTGVAGNALSITAGAALDSNMNGGNMSVNAGAKHGVGTDGVLNLGTTTASAVNLSKTGITSTVKGALTVDEATNLNGTVTIGNAATDELTLTSILASDITFKKGSARTIAPQQAADSTAGDKVSIKAGAGGTTTGAGGDLELVAGAASAGLTNGGNASLDAGATVGGTEGVVSIGGTYGSAVNISKTTKLTTIKGTFQVDEAANLNGATTTLGNAATDTIVLTGVVNSDVTFLKGTARTIKPENAADSTAGDKLSVIAGAGGTTTGAGGDLELSAGAASAGLTNGGNATLDAGATVGGTEGTVSIGATRGSAVNISKTTKLTTIKGTSQFDEDANFNGSITTVGNAATDTLVLTALVNSDITFIDGSARNIKPDQAADSTAGDNLTIAAGQGGTTVGVGGNLSLAAGAAAAGASNGGDASLNAGAKSGAGTDGALSLGTANTNSVSIGIAGKGTTVNGTLAVTEKASLNGAVDFGSAADDLLQFLGVVGSDIVYKTGADRQLYIQQALTGVNGNSLTIAAGAALDSNMNGGNVTINAGAKHGAGDDGQVIIGNANTSGTAVKSTYFAQITAATVGAGVADVGAYRLCEIDTSNDKLQPATFNSQTVFGINADNAAKAAGAAINVGMMGVCPAVADAPIERGCLLKAGIDGRVMRFVNTALSGTDMHNAAAAGIAYTNQPTNDSIQITGNVADDGKTITLIGTTNGTDTVVTEDIVLNNAASPQQTVKGDWGVLLAIKSSSACANPVTVNKTTGPALIRTYPAAVTSDGVLSVAAGSQRAFNILCTIESDAGTTKQIGYKGKSTAYADAYGSQALAGTTPQDTNEAWNLISEIYVGDLEAARTIILNVGAEDDEEIIIGRSITAAAARDDSLNIKIMK